jgi:general secretion pathway protein L
LAKIQLSLLRVRCSLTQPPLRCQWALLREKGDVVSGEGRLADLPRRASRIQLVVPAAEVLFARARLPQAARRRAGPELAYAIEEDTLRDPETMQVSWVGRAGDSDVLAVLDRAGLARWHDALEAAGIAGYEVHCETLLLPFKAGEWRLAWDGREGFVRTAELEGVATDSGDHETPPLSLRLLLEAARREGRAPAAIAVSATASGALPDLGGWRHELDVPLRDAGAWDWSSAPANAGVALAQERRRWRLAPQLLARLRPAAWIAGAALAIHGAASLVDWAVLASEQRSLQARMEARFRGAFPDAVAVVDPALQMRRKLAEARHAAGRSDPGDFLPMMGEVAAALAGLPQGSLRTVSYEAGRMTLGLAAADDAVVRRVITRLSAAGLSAEAPPRAAGAQVVLMVRVP